MTRIYTAGVDGIMIGRGALGNPWIFRQIRQKMAGEDPAEITLQEKNRMIHRHYKLMLESLPEHIAVREMRKHIGWYLHGLRGAARIRNDINHMIRPDEVFLALEQFFEKPVEQENGDRI